MAANQGGIDFSSLMVPMGKRAAEVNVGLLLYGHSGAGKTWLGCQPEKVLVVLLEQNGQASILAGNPGALVLDVVGIAKARNLTTLAVFRDILTQAQAGVFEAMGIRVFTLDSLQEAQRLIKDEHLQELERAAVGRGLTGKDLVKATSPDWQYLKERTRRLCRVLRDLPHDVVCLALAKVDEERDEDGNVLSTLLRPGLEGAIHNEVMGYFSAVGYVHKVVTGKDAMGQPVEEHRVLFSAPSTRCLVKKCATLPGLAHADCRAILARIHSAPGAGVDDGLPVVTDAATADPTEPPPPPPPKQGKAATAPPAKGGKGWGKKKQQDQPAGEQAGQPAQSEGKPAQSEGSEEKKPEVC